MEVEYKRDLYHNYMVIKENEIKDMEPYCIKVLKYQVIDGVLHMEHRNIDNQISFYYDITAKQSLQNLYEKTLLSYTKVKKLFSQMITIIENSYEYLLIEDDFILTPEYVYLDVVTGAPYLCYYCGYHKNIKNQMGSFIEYIMNKVDYNDKEAVLLVYDLYAASKEEGYTLEHLLHIINKQKHVTEADCNKNESIKYLGETTNNFGKKTGNKEISSAVRNEEFEPKGQSLASKIPIMKERLVTEEEVPCYHIKTYLYTVACVLGGIALIAYGLISKVLYNTFGNQLDYSKLFAMFLLTFCIEGYLLNKIWDKKNRRIKILAKKEYVNPIKEFYSKESDRKELEIKKADNKETNYKNSRFESLKAGFVKEKNLLMQGSMKVENQKSIGKEVTMKYNQQPTIETNHICNMERESYQTDIRFPIRSNMKNKDNSNDEYECDQPTCLLNGIPTNRDNEYNQDSEQIHDNDINQDTDQNQVTYISQEAFVKKELTPKKELILKPLDEIGYKNIVITEFPFYIGKLRKNVDYCLEKDIISRYHAKISMEQEHYYITDLNSKNGTYINNEAVETYNNKEIKIGDEIAFANIKFIFLEQDEQ